MANIQALTKESIAAARRYLGQGPMASRAKVGLEDAEGLAKLDAVWSASQRALASLAYSVGVDHPTYIDLKTRISAAVHTAG